MYQSLKHKHRNRHVISNSIVLQVMVCTSAFGMVIDQPDVEIVVRVGCPPSLEQMVQELGRAGRDCRPCRGVILCHDSDQQHAAFWCKEQSPERQ